MTFAYLILAHKNPEQLQRLVGNLLSENVFIFIHVDKKTEETPFVKLLSTCNNVFFCENRISVNWGGFSIVEATVSLIESMIKHIGVPDYAHLLSGQDFPIKDINRIEDFFIQNVGRNFIEYETLPRSDWYMEGMNRIQYDWFIDSLGYERSQELVKYQSPKDFLPNTKAYGGSAWWSLTGDCIVWLWGQCKPGNRIYEYYKSTLCSDEMLFQTMLLHSPFKETIVNTNLRKIDWTIPGSKPHIWLYYEQNMLKESPKLFARKFDEDTDNRILDELEVYISQTPIRKENPAISVVMPVFNSEKYIKESIESVLNQTFNDFELIIIDDSSEDSSIRIVENFNDSRIKLIRNKHDFIDSLNKGLSAAKGNFIARMDADDIMLRERLEVQYDFMISNPSIDVCGSWAECFGLKTGIMRSVTEHDQIVSQLLLENPMIHPSVMIRNESLQKNRLTYKDYPYAEDYKLWVDCVKANCKFAVIPQILLKYRTNEEQVTHTHYEEMFRTSCKIKSEYAEFAAAYIIEKDETYTNLIETLFELTNKNLVEVQLLLNVLHNLYAKLIRS